MARPLDEPGHVAQVELHEHAPVHRLVAIMNESGEITFSSSPSVSVISRDRSPGRRARDDVLVRVVAKDVAEQLGRLHRRAGLDVVLRERERRLAVARVELHRLLVRSNRLGEALHLDVALGELLVRRSVRRRLREGLLCPLDRLVVLARLGLDSLICW